jgi:hypothetical protein
VGQAYYGQAYYKGPKGASTLKSAGHKGMAMLRAAGSKDGDTLKVARVTPVPLHHTTDVPSAHAAPALQMCLLNKSGIERSV